VPASKRKDVCNAPRERDQDHARAGLRLPPVAQFKRGSNTRSMTWITPWLAGTLAVVRPSDDDVAALLLRITAVVQARRRQRSVLAWAQDHAATAEAMVFTHFPSLPAAAAHRDRRGTVIEAAAARAIFDRAFMTVSSA
jgi:hypothetical protein